MDCRKLDTQFPTVLGSKSAWAIMLDNISKFFTSLDLRSGYYLIKCNPQIRHKSAFAIFGKYKFLWMPFGLAQGPVYFTALIQKVLDTLTNFCFFHMDDVLVHDSNEEDHNEHLKMIFLKIRETGLKLKLSKCALFKPFSAAAIINYTPLCCQFPSCCQCVRGKDMWGSQTKTYHIYIWVW